MAHLTADPLALADTVATLRRYSLVRAVADGLYVHRLLQAVVREGLDAEAQQAWVAVAVRLLRAAFPIDSDEVVNWPGCERLLHHVIAVANHGQRLDVAAEGGFGWSIRQLCTWGNDHPDTLATMNDLDAVCHELGEP